MSAAKTKAQDIINNNGVAVFSKSYCPYCKATKELLTKLGAQYYALELDQIGAHTLEDSAVAESSTDTCTDDGAAIQDALKQITNQSSVPNIFINKEHIGGNSDVQALPRDKLKSKLTAAHAL